MYRSKKEVLSSIKKRTTVKDGVDYTTFDVFLGSDPITHKKVRVARSNLKDLKDFISEFYAKLSVGGDAAVHLSYAQSLDARTAYDLITQHDLGISLAECVQMVLDGKSVGKPDATGGVSVGNAWERYRRVALAAKSELYQRTMNARVGAWVMRFGPSRSMGEITAAEVKTYLVDNYYKADDPATMTTYNGILGDIKTFVNWCCSPEQKLLSENPLAPMKKLKVGYRQPEYMKAETVEKLFRELEKNKDDYPEDLADAVLSFFCGMRQCEIERIREGVAAVHISLEDNFICVKKCKGSENGIRPRTFDIPAQAASWMASFDFLAAVMKPNPRFRRHLLRRAKSARIKLPSNAGRHTFITMYEAVHHDANSLSAIVGNSDGVRAKSYNGVEIKREGEAYFKIMPTATA